MAKFLQAVFWSLIFAPTVWSQPAVSYHGAVVICDEVFVSLASPKLPPKWCGLGDTYLGLKVVKVSERFAEVTCLNEKNEQVLLPLRRAEPGGPTRHPESLSLIGLEQLDWKWIRSEANPMRSEAPDLPYEQAMTWKNWQERDRIALRNFYRTHGWDLVVEVNERRIKVERVPLHNPGEPRVRDKSKNLEAIPAKL